MNKQKMNPAQVRLALKMIKAGDSTPPHVAKLFGVSRQYVYWLCSEAGIDMELARQKYAKKQASQLKKLVRIKTA